MTKNRYEVWLFVGAKKSTFQQSFLTLEEAQAYVHESHASVGRYLGADAYFAVVDNEVQKYEVHFEYTFTGKLEVPADSEEDARVRFLKTMDSYSSSIIVDCYCDYEKDPALVITSIKATAPEAQ